MVVSAKRTQEQSCVRLFFRSNRENAPERCAPELVDYMTDDKTPIAAGVNCLWITEKVRGQDR